MGGFKRDDYVVYRNYGVCKINDIREEDFSKDGAKKYYVINQVEGDGAKFYVPTDWDGASVFIRPVLSKNDIDTAIADAEKLGTQWIDDRDDRASALSSVMASGNVPEILHAFKVLYRRKHDAAKTGHRFNECDKKFLNEAEKMITGEFAFSLGIHRSDVIPYIVDHVDAGSVKGDDAENG